MSMHHFCYLRPLFTDYLILFLSRNHVQKIACVPILARTDRSPHIVLSAYHCSQLLADAGLLTAKLAVSVLKMAACNKTVSIHNAACSVSRRLPQTVQAFQRLPKSFPQHEQSLTLDGGHCVEPSWELQPALLSPP